MNISKSNNSFLLFNDCSKLVLDIFIDCIVDSNLKGLIISGVPTDKQLSEAWDKIYVQSCQIAQNGTYNEVFSVLKEIDDLRAKITIASNTVRHLDISSQNELPFDQDLINILNSLALRCNLKDSDTREVVVTKLNSVIARAKKWVPRLTEREAKLNEIRSTNNTKIDREYFDDWLEAMSKDKGYHVKSNEITVSRFYRSMAKMNEDSRKEQIKHLQRAK